MGSRSCLLLLLLAGSVAHGEDWPQWRGPNADGHSSETGFPVEWDSEENVLWKSALDGRGASTPIVWDDLVILTYQVGEGPMEQRVPRERGTTAPWETRYEPGDPVHLFVEAFHRRDGRSRWRYRVETGEPVPNVYPSHNLASPSVVTDGELVYAWFGDGRLLALGLDGGLVWERHLGRDYFAFRVQRGHASSPVIHGETLWLLVDHTDRAMLLGLDKRTGAERLRIDRGRGRRSYSTPVVAGDAIVVNSSEAVEAYDPRTGKLRWSAGEPVTLAIPMPVLHEEVLFVIRGYSSSPYLAIGEGGDVLWREPTRGPYVSSFVHHDGLLYMATERGIGYAIDAATGEIVWRERLGGVYTASPVAAEGRIYFVAESGETVVLESGRAPRVLSRNPLGERMLASPALSGGVVFLRSDRHLFAVGTERLGETDGVRVRLRRAR